MVSNDRCVSAFVISLVVRIVARIADSVIRDIWLVEQEERVQGQKPPKDVDNHALYDALSGLHRDMCMASFIPYLYDVLNGQPIFYTPIDGEQINRVVEYGRNILQKYNIAYVTLDDIIRQDTSGVSGEALDDAIVLAHDAICSFHRAATATDALSSVDEHGMMVHERTCNRVVESAFNMHTQLLSNDYICDGSSIWYSISFAYMCNIIASALSNFTNTLRQHNA